MSGCSRVKLAIFLVLAATVCAKRVTQTSEDFFETGGATSKKVSTAGATKTSSQGDEAVDLGTAKISNQGAEKTINQRDEADDLGTAKISSQGDAALETEVEENVALETETEADSALETEVVEDVALEAETEADEALETKVEADKALKTGVEEDVALEAETEADEALETKVEADKALKMEAEADEALQTETAEMVMKGVGTMHHQERQENANRAEVSDEESKEAANDEASEVENAKNSENSYKGFEIDATAEEYVDHAENDDENSQKVANVKDASEVFWQRRRGYRGHVTHIHRKEAGFKTHDQIVADARKEADKHFGHGNHKLTHVDIKCRGCNKNWQKQNKDWHKKEKARKKQGRKHSSLLESDSRVDAEDFVEDSQEASEVEGAYHFEDSDQQSKEENRQF